MTGWFSYILVFLCGIGVGVFFASKRTPASTGLATIKESGKSLKRLYKLCPQFFDNIREELGRPGFEDVREFAILESSSVTYVSDKLKFIYYQDEMPNLTDVATALEKDGFVDDISKGKTPVYHLRDNFLSAIRSL